MEICKGGISNLWGKDRLFNKYCWDELTDIWKKDKINSIPSG